MALDYALRMRAGAGKRHSKSVHAIELSALGNWADHCKSKPVEIGRRENPRILRNTAWVNMMDGCALTLPCHKAGEAPVGLQLVGRHGGDHALLSLGAAFEAVLRDQ